MDSPAQTFHGVNDDLTVAGRSCAVANESFGTHRVEDKEFIRPCMEEIGEHKACVSIVKKNREWVADEGREYRRRSISLAYIYGMLPQRENNTGGMPESRSYQRMVVHIGNMLNMGEDPLNDRPHFITCRWQNTARKRCDKRRSLPEERTLL